MAYLDAAQERLAVASKSAFVSAVEAVRVGTVAAQDAKAYARWKRWVDPVKRGSGLTGQALEQAVMRVAAMFPDNVETVRA